MTPAAAAVVDQWLRQRERRCPGLLADLRRGQGPASETDPAAEPEPNRPRRWTVRPWTEDGPRLRRWAAEGVPYTEIARRLERPVGQVYGYVDRSGLQRRRRCPATPEVLGVLAAVMEAGRCDRCAADAAGCERHTAARRRSLWGMPPNPGNGCPCVRGRAREQMRGQLARGEHPRVVGHARYARGWPEDLRHRAVQILDLLYARGPMTRREIAEALGMPWKGSSKSLVSNDPEGTYLAHLQARGLVVRLGRRQQGTRYEHVYATPLWVERGAVS